MLKAKRAAAAAASSRVSAVSSSASGSSFGPSQRLSGNADCAATFGGKTKPANGSFNGSLNGSPSTALPRSASKKLPPVRKPLTLRALHAAYTGKHGENSFIAEATTILLYDPAQPSRLRSLVATQRLKVALASREKAPQTEIPCLLLAWLGGSSAEGGRIVAAAKWLWHSTHRMRNGGGKMKKIFDVAHCVQLPIRVESIKDNGSGQYVTDAKGLDFHLDDMEMTEIKSTKRRGGHTHRWNEPDQMWTREAVRATLAYIRGEPVDVEEIECEWSADGVPIFPPLSVKPNAVTGDGPKANPKAMAATATVSKVDAHTAKGAKKIAAQKTSESTKAKAQRQSKKAKTEAAAAVAAALAPAPCVFPVAAAASNEHTRAPTEGASSSPASLASPIDVDSAYGFLLYPWSPSPMESESQSDSDASLASLHSQLEAEEHKTMEINSNWSRSMQSLKDERQAFSASMESGQDDINEASCSASFASVGAMVDSSDDHADDDPLDAADIESVCCNGSSASVTTEPFSPAARRNKRRHSEVDTIAEEDEGEEEVEEEGQEEVEEVEEEVEEEQQEGEDEWVDEHEQLAQPPVQVQQENELGFLTPEYQN